MSFINPTDSNHLCTENLSDSLTIETYHYVRRGNVLIGDVLIQTPPADSSTPVVFLTQETYHIETPLSVLF